MRNYLLLLIALSLGMTFIACNKDSADPADEILSTVAAEDESLIAYLADDTEELEDAVITLRNNEEPCLQITWLNAKGTFPNTVTLDFGDGCEGPNGHIRAGRIIMTQTARMSESNATRTTTFDNFTIDGIAIAGSKTLVNQGTDSVGHNAFQRTTDLLLTYPNGQTASRNAEQTRMQIAGGETQLPWDDVFEITGFSSGTTRNGTNFGTQIMEPLIKPRNCRWIIDGTLEVTRGDKTRTVDYGYLNASCDRLAEVTFSNGQTRIIRIHNRWWQ